MVENFLVHSFSRLVTQMEMEECGRRIINTKENVHIIHGISHITGRASLCEADNRGSSEPTRWNPRETARRMTCPRLRLSDGL